jgi:hypothetical protein
MDQPDESCRSSLLFPLFPLLSFHSLISPTPSRGALRTLSQRLAHGLRHKLALQPGAVLAMISPNSFYYHALVLATQCAGVVYSGANAAYAPGELAHQLEDSGAGVVRFFLSFCSFLPDGFSSADLPFPLPIFRPPRSLLSSSCERATTAQSSGSGGFSI